MKTGAFPITIFVEDQIVDPFGTGDIYIYEYPSTYIYTYICMDLYIHPYGYILFRQVCEDFQRAHRPRKCSRSQGVTMGHCPKKNWTR